MRPREKPEHRHGGWPVLRGALAGALLLTSVSGGVVGAAPMFQADGEMIEDSEPPPVRPARATAPDPGQLVKQVVALVNAERARQGAPALQVNENLVKAAQDYSGILGQGGCFEHTCAPVPELRSRVANAGYANMNRIGENIAAGDQTAESVMQGWLNSPGHRRNILNPELREIGVGVSFTQAEFGSYWVQVFGTRPQ